MPKSNKKPFKKIFLEIHFDTWNAVSTIPPKFSKNGGKMFQSPKIIKKHSFFPAKSVFLQIYSMDT